MILASISTLESAGIHDSGSSTRSWMGILLLLDVSRQHHRTRVSGAAAAAVGDSRSVTHPCPTMASCFMLEKRNGSAGEARATGHTHRRGHTHLLMLSILSILVMPSQWRMSGIKAWKRMSLTPAMFSVRLK